MQPDQSLMAGLVHDSIGDAQGVYNLSAAPWASAAPLVTLDMVFTLAGTAIRHPVGVTWFAAPRRDEVCGSSAGTRAWSSWPTGP